MGLYPMFVELLITNVFFLKNRLKDAFGFSFGLILDNTFVKIINPTISKS